jgi:hypothetical protein
MKWLLAMFFATSMIAQAQVTPQQVESMLDQMVRENVISAQEAEKAKLRMKNMNSQEWNDINKKAESIAQRSPASLKPSNNKIEEVQNIDLDSAQFKEIQNEVKKIMPQYNDD